MRATSLSSAGPVRARPTRGCEARTRGSHSPIHKHKTWTKSRGPVTALAGRGSSALDRLTVRLADETGAVGKYGNLGTLANRADETLADVIRSRGGGASQVKQLQSGYGELTLRGLSERASSGDREAARAIKMAKQAGSQGKGGR